MSTTTTPPTTEESASAAMSGSLRALHVEPSHDSRFDSFYVLAGKTWKDGLDLVEQSLDSQFNEKPWDEIKCTITCCFITPEEWDEISSNE